MIQRRHGRERRGQIKPKLSHLASTAMFGGGEMLGMTQIPASLQSNMQVESSAKGTGQRFKKKQQIKVMERPSPSLYLNPICNLL